MTPETEIERQYAAELAKTPVPVPMECKCSLRIRLVGDGCPVCNPDYWEQFKDNDRREGEGE